MSLPASWAVFPLLPVVNGKCGCNNPECARVGKHPAVLWGDWSPGQQEIGDGGVGVRTGAEFGIFVVETDQKPGVDGAGALAALGSLPRTYRVRTPSGSIHNYFRHPGAGVRIKTSGNEVAPGVDVRGEGGFVVGQGSPHRLGGTYLAMDDTTFSDIVDAPAWLLEAIAATRTERSFSSGGVVPLDMESADGKRSMERGIQAAMEWEPAVDGAGGSSVNAFNLAQTLVRKLQVPQDVAFEVMSEYYSPRCLPPWSEAELRHKVSSAALEGTWMPELNSVAFDEALNEVARAAKAKEREEQAEKVATKGARKVHDPSHRYTFAPGDMQNGGADKAGANQATTVLRTHSDWEGVLQFDVFARKTLAVDPPVKLDAEGAIGYSDADTSAIQMWFEARADMKVTLENVNAAVLAAARENSFHPVKEYLANLPEVTWDRILPGLALRLFGDDGPMAETFLTRFLIAAVRRVKNPGVKCDTMLVLQGKQGAKKSSLVCELFGGDRWFLDQMPPLEHKDSSSALNGHWCVEFAELEQVLRAGDEVVKAFLSRRVDKYRPSHARQEIAAPRSVVFIGTTNSLGFLRDATGDRRFWPIRVLKEIDLAWLRENRDRIWAEVVELEAAGAVHWISAEEETEASDARAIFEDRDPWEDLVRDYCAGREKVKLVDVYTIAISSSAEGAAARLGTRETRRLTGILTRLGLAPVKLPGGLRRWKVPEDLSAATPSPAERLRRQVSLAQEAMANAAERISSN